MTACGARYFSLVNTHYKVSSAQSYYVSVIRQLLERLQSKDRTREDTSVCAITAVINNVYEMMSETTALHMQNRIAATRALIQECGWDARSTGLAGACFWFNVGIEVLNCALYNWSVEWDPDLWCFDLGQSEHPTKKKTRTNVYWVHSIFYVLAKTVNYRATAPEGLYAYGLGAEDAQRAQVWDHLYRLSIWWRDSTPRTMQPLASSDPEVQSATSCFPSIW